jgi:hypothetical protein
MTEQQEIRTKALELAINFFIEFPQIDNPEEFDKAWMYIEPMADAFQSYVRDGHQ